jgi:hypothetical protein
MNEVIKKLEQLAEEINSTDRIFGGEMHSILKFKKQLKLISWGLILIQI